jgi:hypothetical protein
MVVNSIDPRDQRTVRSRAFQTLNGLGLAASALTSIAIPGGSNSLPLGLDKYSNVLVPGLGRLFPNLKDTERQNVVNMTMRQIEEIPWGSDISKIVFFPKREFSGVLPGHKVRISGIDPYHFYIKVAILEKQGTVSGSGRN